jgi:hypothetical protein
MYSSVEMITPQKAVEILDTKNFNNRPVSQFTVDRYAQEMKADEFFTTFQSGLNLKAGDPILMLRNRLISSARDKVNKITREAMYAYTVYAWNAFVEGKQLRGFSYKPAEPLPEILGLGRETAASLLEW